MARKRKITAKQKAALKKGRAKLRQIQAKGRTKRAIAGDKKRTAKLPGKRISAAGNVYYERRANRSDRSKKTRL